MKHWIGIFLVFSMFSTAHAQEKKPSIFDTIKQKVKENISVNGEPLAQPTGQTGTKGAAAGYTSNMSAIDATYWRQPNFIPEVLDGSAHVRVHGSGAGVDQFGNLVSGAATCDLLFVFVAKTGKKLDEKTLDECAWLEFDLARKRSEKLPYFDTGHPEGKAAATKHFRPFVADRIEHYKKFDTFYIRPNNSIQYKHWSPDKGVLELQTNIASPGSTRGGDVRFTGPGWTNLPYDSFTKRRKTIPQSYETQLLMQIQMDAADGEFFDKALALGPDNQLHFKFNSGKQTPLGNGAFLNQMDVNVYKLKLVMGGAYGGKRRVLEFDSTD